MGVHEPLVCNIHKFGHDHALQENERNCAEACEILPLLHRFVGKTVSQKVETNEKWKFNNKQTSVYELSYTYCGFEKAEAAKNEDDHVENEISERKSYVRDPHVIITLVFLVLVCNHPFEKAVLEIFWMT